ncbi:MAG TPA: hypothetical protein VFH43_09615, partial [Candidatus Kapabacteria bacterium]|nr:hypothetical protein [Candidatus Kapabacteria bacterium]
MFHSSVLLLCALGLFAIAPDSFAQSSGDRQIPTLTKSPVYDETNTLTPGEVAQLDQKLRAFEDSTSTPI